MSRIVSRTIGALLLSSASLVSLSSGAQATPGRSGASAGFCRALGDSLTAGYIDKASGSEVSYPAFLQTLGTCPVVSNEGVAGQISTQIAVRSGGLPTTATITGGTIPTIASVGIVFKPGTEPTTRSSTFSVPMTISGVAGIVTHVGSLNVFTRSVPGLPAPSAPDSPISAITGPLNDGFVIIWAGKNNANNPGQVLSDIAAMVDVLPRPKRFVVLSVTNSNQPLQWQGGGQYDGYMALDAALASRYPSNFLDIRSLLVAAYDPKVPEDVIDHKHDVIPSSLRLYYDLPLAAPVADTTSCTSVPSGGGTGTTVQIDDEKIYVSNAGRGFAANRGCIRGYAGTVAATHNAGAPLRNIDATHLNADGYMFVARKINDWMIANSRELGR